MSDKPFDRQAYDFPIEGWCATEIFWALERFFAPEGGFSKPGPVCEIGVHHGKFLIGAHNALGGTKALGIDIFEDQARNVDGSGKGSLESFRSAIAAHALRPGEVDSLAMDSFEIGARDIDELLSRYGRFKVFSVDGGHTPEHVMNDMRIAQEMTAQDGIILVDDFFAPHWPGVTEGMHRLFASHGVRFAPFLSLTNKLFLTGLSFHERALQHARQVTPELAGQFEFRPVSFFGYPSLSGVGY